MAKGYKGISSSIAKPAWRQSLKEYVSQQSDKMSCKESSKKSCKKCCFYSGEPTCLRGVDLHLAGYSSSCKHYQSSM